MSTELEVDTAAFSLPVSVAGGLWTPRTPLLLGYRVNIIRELWRTEREWFSLRDAASVEKISSHTCFTSKHTVSTVSNLLGPPSFN